MNDMTHPVARLGDAVASGLVGHKEMVERLLVALVAGGHVLIEGPPGIAKTRAVKRLAASLPGSHARIQCTPDLLPADLTGTQVFRPESGGFDFVAGPLFHSLVLVDEINRAPPKVQSALLEAMAEGQVTTAGITRPLPDPFMVVATQNPIEHEGTFPLPEAQMDRFLLHLSLSLPEADEERAILDLVAEERMRPPAAPGDPLPAHILHAAKAEAARVHLSPALKDFIVRLVMASRPGGVVSEWVEHAISPRHAGARRGRAGPRLAARPRLRPAGRRHRPGAGRARPSPDPELGGGKRGAHGPKPGGRHHGQGRAVVKAALSGPGIRLEAADLMALRDEAVAPNRVRPATRKPGAVAAKPPGAGMDLREIRVFSEGDDARRIDASATARTGTPHIRSFHEDRDDSLLLIADFRPAMLWGTGDALRSVRAARASPGPAGRRSDGAPRSPPSRSQRQVSRACPSGPVRPR